MGLQCLDVVCQDKAIGRDRKTIIALMLLSAIWIWSMENAGFRG